MIEAPSGQKILPVAEVRHAFERISVDAYNCEVLIEAAMDAIAQFRSELREGLGTTGTAMASDVNWYKPEALLHIAREKAGDARERADELQSAEIGPGEPLLLRGAKAVAGRLGITNAQADHLDKAGQLPTFRVPGDGTLHATATGLDDWRRLPAAAELIR